MENSTKLSKQTILSQQKVLQLIFSKRQRLHIFESIRLGLKFLLAKANFAYEMTYPDVFSIILLYEPRQANLCLRAFRHDKL